MQSSSYLRSGVIIRMYTGQNYNYAATGISNMVHTRKLVGTKFKHFSQQITTKFKDFSRWKIPRSVYTTFPDHITGTDYSKYPFSSIVGSFMLITWCVNLLVFKIIMFTGILKLLFLLSQWGSPKTRKRSEAGSTGPQAWGQRVYLSTHFQLLVLVHIKYLYLIIKYLNYQVLYFQVLTKYFSK